MSGRRRAHSGTTRFTRRVLAAVRRIPRGRVATYGDIARLAGPGAARAVGNVMRGCAGPGVPCHRVVAAGGALGGYSHPALKRSLLAAEGDIVRGRRIRVLPSSAVSESKWVQVSARVRERRSVDFREASHTALIRPILRWVRARSGMPTAARPDPALHVHRAA